jgi:hypothetical protein
MATDTVQGLFSKELLFSYALTFVAAILGIGSLFLLPSEVPIWFSLAIPEQQLMPKVLILVFPVTMLVICLLHTLIIRRLRSMDETIIKIFSFGTTLTTLLLLVGLIHIMYLFL